MRTTNFVLTADQEAKLVDYLFLRVDALRQTNGARIEADKKSWKRYLNDARDRKQEGSIYELSNLHMPITGMIVDHFVSRTEDEVAGEAPFFHFEAVGPSDRPQAVDFNHYFNWKLDTKGKVHVALKEAFVPAFVQRATILKAVHVDQRKQWIDRDRKVLVDLTTKQPVQVPNHGVVVEGEDEWVEMGDPVAAAPETLNAERSTPNAEVSDPKPQTRLHLKVDPTLVFDPTRHEFQLPPAGLKREEVLYRGGKSVIVPSDRFLCPMDAPSIDEADVCAEERDEDLAWFRSMWLERPWARWAESEHSFTTGDASAKTARDSEDSTQRENLSFDRLNPRRRVIEFWVRRDVLEWGVPQEFVIFLDTESRKPIFYEFQAKVCPDFKRPFTALTVTKCKPGSWCAEESLAEKIIQYQDGYDRQFNAYLYRNWMQANPIKWMNPQATVEEEEDLVFDPQKVYHGKPGKTIDDFVSFKGIPDLDQNTKDLADAILYLLQLWLSVSNLAQGDYSDIPQNNTATGVKQAIAESSKLNRRWIRRLIAGFEEHLLKIVEITAATFPDNAQETYDFTEGEDHFTGQVTAKEIRQFDINVRLVVSSRYDAEQAEAAQKAMEVQTLYFEALVNPAVAAARRPLLIQILESLGFKNAHELLPAPAQMMAPPALMAGPGAGGPIPMAGQGAAA